MSNTIQPDLPGTEPDPNDKLGQIMALANKMEALHVLQTEKIQELEVITEDGKRIQEVLLPDLMTEVGLTELTLTSGRKIIIKRDIFTNVSKERFDAAEKWLIANNMASIIKTQVIVPDEFVTQLMLMKLPFEVKKSIHPQTLKALVKEQIEQNNSTFPKETFAVFEKTMAMVKD